MSQITTMRHFHPLSCKAVELKIENVQYQLKHTLS